MSSVTDTEVDIRAIKERYRWFYVGKRREIYMISIRYRKCIPSISSIYIVYTSIWYYILLYTLFFFWWDGKKMITSFQLKFRKIWLAQVVETAVLQFPQIPRTPWSCRKNKEKSWIFEAKDVFSKLVHPTFFEYRQLSLRIFVLYMRESLKYVKRASAFTPCSKKTYECGATTVFFTNVETHPFVATAFRVGRREEIGY